MTGNVCVLGLYNTDLVFQGARLPIMGETIMGDSFISGPGGKGSNQAIAIARTGTPVTMICKLGKDSYGEQGMALFAKENINTDYISHSTTGTSSPMAFVFVDANVGDNAIIVVPGAGGEINNTDIDKATPALKDADVFITQLETPLAVGEYALKRAQAENCITILNPAPACPLPDSIYQYIDIITPNETEVEILTGIVVTTESDAEKAADILRTKGVETVIITLGSRGVYVKNSTINQMLPSFKVENVVDTTGAGDAFHGGFAHKLADGKLADGNDILQACTYGCAVAALSVTRKGAADSIPNKDEVADFLKEKGKT